MIKHPAFQNKAFKFVLFLAILAGCWYLGRVFKIDVSTYQELLSGYSLAIAGLVFVVLYVGMTTVIWLGPKDVLRISSAFIFGATVSTVFVWIGEMINAAIMFHLSRVLGRGYVLQRLGVAPEKLDQMQDDASLLSVIAWRVNPLIPFRLMDLGYGLSKITFRKYLSGIIGISFFRILWLQYILAFLGDNLFGELPVIVQHLMDHPYIVKVNAVYILAVIVVTVVAVMARSNRKRKGKRNGTPE